MLPLDDAFDRLHADITVTYFMLPTSSSSTDLPVKDPKNAMSDGPYGKGKGKRGKGKGKGPSRTPMPTALIGMHSRTPQGETICYSFNLNAKTRTAQENMCAVFPDVTRLIRRVNTRSREKRCNNCNRRPWTVLLLWTHNSWRLMTLMVSNSWIFHPMNAFQSKAFVALLV